MNNYSTLSKDSLSLINGGRKHRDVAYDKGVQIGVKSRHVAELVGLILGAGVAAGL